MTGHLVFSTVHSREAISGLFRLLDLGVEPYVGGVGASRGRGPAAGAATLPPLQGRQAPHRRAIEKVRRLRHRQRQAGLPTQGLQEVLRHRPFRPAGGVRNPGRHRQVAQTVLKNPSLDACQKALTPEGYISLQESGYRLIAEGAAGFDEVEKTIA